jgi:hypothetical protein
VGGGGGGGGGGADKKGGTAAKDKEKELEEQKQKAKDADKEKMERRPSKKFSAVNDDGDLIQGASESAIANTVISGVMTTRDSRLLGLGALCRQLTLRVIRKRQLRALHAMQNVATTPKAQKLLQNLVDSANDDDGCAAPSDAKSGKSLFTKVLAAFDEVVMIKPAKKEPMSWKLASSKFSLLTSAVSARCMMLIC